MRQGVCSLKLKQPFFLSRMLSTMCGVTAKHKFLQASFVRQLCRERKGKTMEFCPNKKKKKKTPRKWLFELNRRLSKFENM